VIVLRVPRQAEFRELAVQAVESACELLATDEKLPLGGGDGSARRIAAAVDLAFEYLTRDSGPDSDDMRVQIEFGDGWIQIDLDHAASAGRIREKLRPLVDHVTCRREGTGILSMRSRLVHAGAGASAASP
jgi:hypothetical protein